MSRANSRVFVVTSMKVCTTRGSLHFKIIMPVHYQWSQISFCSQVSIYRHNWMYLLVRWWWPRHHLCLVQGLLLHQDKKKYEMKNEPTQTYLCINTFFRSKCSSKVQADSKTSREKGQGQKSRTTEDQTGRFQQQEKALLGMLSFPSCCCKHSTCL